jgi:hypothetical protein
MMKRKFFLLLFIFSITLISAQNFSYRLNKPDSLFIGTPFDLRIEIITALADSIFVPQIDTMDVFVLKGNIRSWVETSPSDKKTTIEYTFQPFDTGEHTLPKLELSVRSDGKLKSFQTDPIPLIIYSVLQDSTGEMRDIAPPIKMNFGFWDYAAAFLIVFILIGVVILLKKILRKKPKITEKKIITDDRSAFEKAMELLEKLKSKKLLENGKFLPLHFELSYILRFFLENQYHIHAMEMTTSEIREHFLPQNSKEKSLVMEFLLFADRIKFAKFIPEYEQSKAAMEWLESYILSYKEVVDKEKENA